MAEVQCSMERRVDELGEEGRTRPGGALNASGVAFVKDARSIGHFSDHAILSPPAELTILLLFITLCFLALWTPSSLSSLLAPPAASPVTSSMPEACFSHHSVSHIYDKMLPCNKCCVSLHPALRCQSTNNKCWDTVKPFCQD